VSQISGSELALYGAFLVRKTPYLFEKIVQVFPQKRSCIHSSLQQYRKRKALLMRERQVVLSVGFLLTFFDSVGFRPFQYGCDLKPSQDMSTQNT
jgi:hypothetical protein